MKTGSDSQELTIGLMFSSPVGVRDTNHLKGRSQAHVTQTQEVTRWSTVYIEAEESENEHKVGLFL